MARAVPCGAVVAHAVSWWPEWCHAVLWWPVRCRAWHGGPCRAWWTGFQPHLVAAVPGPKLSPFVRRHIPVVASERTGCLISQLRREPPHFSKCRRKICLLLFSSIPCVPGSKGLLGKVLSPKHLGPEGRGLVGRWIFGWKQRSGVGQCFPEPRARLAEAQPCTLPMFRARSCPCGSGATEKISGWFLPPFPERFCLCDPLGDGTDGFGGLFLPIPALQ